ncbi:choice-of-anchor D domain-containing protein [Winogradskyella maritima]|uniref:LamG-like jellyroll fold domain-containing protein n=1 Tax=Winogradskyella maritima TaxID=1517766 RepID=A0ABV8AC92_9FLAO|nr:choice-of-anchor D domain-containing protein [Winogradskyella maritima]
MKNLYTLAVCIFFCAFALTAYSQTGVLQVQGNGLTITNGDSTPDFSDDTDFGLVEVGTTYSRVFTLRNITTANGSSNNLNNVTIDVSGSSAFSPTTLNIGQIKKNKSNTHTITFAPSDFSIQTATVTVTTSNGGTDVPYTFTIRGQGSPPKPEINLVDVNGNNIDDGSTNSPSVINSTSFGSTDTLNPISISYTIENTGNGTLNISSVTSSNTDFAITLAPSASVPGNDTTLFTVTFTPTSTGVISSTITVNNDDDAPEDIYTFTVEGQGTAPPPVYTYIHHTFDATSEGWTNATSTNGSWVRTNTFTTADEMGEGYFFRNSNYNSYLSSADIVIESPTYDFTGLQNLKLTIDIKYNTENNVDGMRILYSVGGSAYTVLGAAGEGTNWYQDNVNALGSDGWNDDGHSPDTAFSPHSQFGQSSINLDGGTFNNQSNVKFRIQFSSDASTNLEGVAFDNFIIEADPSIALGTSPTAPANITSNLRLWLKTNAGIANTDNTPLTLWEDQASTSSLDKENAIAETSIAPTYRDSGTRNINFNPVVDFDNTAVEYMNGKGGFFSQDYFVVFRSDDTLENNTGSFTPGRQFAVGGRYADQSFHEDATGLAAGSSTARYTDEVIAHNISSFPNGTQAPNATSYGRAYTSTTDTFSNHPVIVNVKSNSGRTASEIYKNGKRVDNTTGQAGNGDDLNFNENNNLPYLVGTGRSGINGRTTSQMNGMIAEIISYSSPNSATNQKKIQSYLAVKYGVTLQDNASALLDHRLNDTDYIDSQGDVIWDTSDTDIDGNFHNYDVAGIGRDDASNLDQRQSRSQNDEADGTGPTSGFLSMALTDTYDTNKLNQANTTGFEDREFLMWGNNNASLDAAAISITVDMSEDIGDPALTTNVSFESMSRIWKVVENRPTGTSDIGVVEVSIPVSVVRTATPPDGRYLMFISQNGQFDPTADYRVMTETGGRLYTKYDFDGTEYITFGWAPERLFTRSIAFDPARSTYIDMEDNFDLDASNSNGTADFTISAWIKRDANSANTSILSKRNVAYTEGYDIKITSDNKLEMSWMNGSLRQLRSTVDIPLNEWHQVAFIYSSGTLSMYIDGVFHVASSLVGPLETTSSFFVGGAAKLNPQSFFHGNIDEVRIWNKALSEAELHYVMNQELDNNATTIGLYFDSKSIVPTKNDGSTLSYADLEGYYPMSRYTYTNTKDESGNLRTGALKQLKTVDYQTAPLPYMSTQDGDWDSDATWVNGSVQTKPGAVALADATKTVNWNIVETSHDITMDNSTLVDDADGDGNYNRSVLAHTIESGTLTVDGDVATTAGFGYTVTHYLNLKGKIDLEGESQLIQSTDSDLIVGVNGELERDQQGTNDIYHYNYWSAPIGTTDTGTNKYSYSIADIMKDRTFDVNFITNSYDGAPGTMADPVEIADYWIWKFADNPDGDYSEWEHVRSTGTMLAGEGYTMKGSNTADPYQNYTFLGKPNNGNIELTVSDGHDYLVGNPYASAISARQFIIDNGPALFYQQGLIQVSLNSTTGNPNLDGNSNPIYVDNQGNLYYMRWSGGSPVSDGNGNPIYEDTGGNPHYMALDGGSPVLDDNGYPVYIITGTEEATASTSGTLYFWEHWGGSNHILAQYQGGYATYNLAGAASAPYSNLGVNDPDVSAGGTPTKTPGDYIPVGQGFFVIGNTGGGTGTIQFNNGQRAFKRETASNGLFVRNAEATTQDTDQLPEKNDTRRKVKIGFNSVTDLHRQLLLTFDRRTTPGIDWGFDGTTYDYQTDDMFWLIEDNFYVIQSNRYNDIDVYPLGLYTSVDGENSITIDELINMPENIDIFLHDKELEIYHDLRASDYTIFLNEGYYDSRFEITFKTNPVEQDQPDETPEDPIDEDTDEDIAETLEPEIEGDELSIIYSNDRKKIILTNPHNINVSQIAMYNMLGQNVLTFNNISASGYAEFNVRNLTPGTYIIRAETESGSVTKKTIVN